MIYYTKYAEKKFDILNKHGVFFTKEQIKDTIKLPDKTGIISTTSNKKEFHSCEKDGIKVIFKKESGIIIVVTFYPTKEKTYDI